MKKLLQIKMPTLQEILEQEQTIFIDGSIRASEFPSIIYEAKCYEDLNLKEIKSEIENTKRFLEIMNNPKTRTIPEVTKELRRYHQIIGNTLNFLKQNTTHKVKRYHLQKPIGKSNKQKSKIQEWNLQKRQALEELEQVAFKVEKATRSKYSNFSLYQQYMAITRIAIDISKTIGLKKIDNYERYEFFERKRKKQYSDTDEKLASALLISCLIGNERSALLTMDNDLEQLLIFIPELLGCEEFLPYNREFREALKVNPFSLYFLNQEDQQKYTKIIGELPQFYPKTFKPKSEEEHSLKQRIYNFWANQCIINQALAI